MAAWGAISFSDAAAVIALVVSVVAAGVSYYFAQRQAATSRDANALPTFTEFFQEHRSPELAAARTFLGSDAFRTLDLSEGLEALPENHRQPVLALMWFYDNLGALVTHGIVEPEPVSGYLGGSIIRCWEQLEELITAERDRRGDSPDPNRWQDYFENVYILFRDEVPPAQSREKAKRWKTRAARVASDNDRFRLRG